MTRVNTQSRFIEQFSKYGQSRKLGDVVKLMDDRRKPINDAERQSMKTGELYPYYGATGQVDSINSYLTDDTLLCIAEDCGNYKGGEESSYIITGKAWVNNHAHLVKPNEDCDITFLHYYLTISDLSSYVTGTTRQKLTQKSLVSIPVVTPPVEEQKAFVSIVLQADKSKFIGFKSRFFEQFADLPFDHKWKDVLTIINGKAYGEEYKVSGTYPICGSGGIMGYGEKKMCNRNSIILGRKGNIDKPIYMSEDYWIVDTAFCLSPNTELIHPVYLYHWCKQFDFQKLNKQAVLPSLTRTDLEQIDIQVPEMAEQLAFVAIVRQADKSKYLN